MSIDAASVRYARQRALAGFGAAAQQSLADARVLVIGAGGLGSAVLPTLAAAGVGTIAIVDDDTVDESNLHRQTLYSPRDVGRPKAQAAAEALLGLSPDAAIEGRPVRFDVGTAEALSIDVDLIVDASDNTPTRYLANDVAARRGIPLVWGNALGWTGQAGVAWDARGADYRDLFPVEAPEDGASCATVGVLPSVCTTIGGLMASEALKILTASGEPLVGRVINLDARSGRLRELAYRRDPALRARSAAASAPRPAERPGAVGPAELRALLADGAPPVLLDVREPWEAERASIPGSVLIPLGELADRYGELDPQAATVVYCHRGPRAVQAMEFLRQHGFRTVEHLDGGISAWLRDADPSRGSR